MSHAKLKVNSRARSYEVLPVSESCKVRVRVESMGAFDVALDMDQQVMLVLKRRHFADDYDFMRWEALGARPQRPVTGYLLLAEIRSPQEFEACTIDGVALGDLVDQAPGELWVSVSYFWKDLGFFPETDASADKEPG